MQSIGKMPENIRKNKKKNVKSSHSTSSIKSHSKMNGYRNKLNALYKQKKTQRKKNSELTCKIKKWRISENPNLGKKNKEKLTKLTQKACQLQKKYLNVLSRIDINENRALAEMKKIKKKSVKKKKDKKKKKKKNPISSSSSSNGSSSSRKTSSYTNPFAKKIKILWNQLKFL